MTRLSSILANGAALVAVLAPAAGLAQDAGGPVSRAVVQPLPDPAASRLAEVLRALAREPRSLPLLVEAGEASLRLEDATAAEAFFKRAEAVDPANVQLKAGKASLALRQGEPLEALRLFEQAEAAGVGMAPYASDRGLAFDLVGDNARAQQEYQKALALGPDTAVSLRLALSQAIAGDARASETTLLPLLQRSDLAAYRTRAFALAIAGKEEEAVSVAQAMLPERISGRMAPYLRFMPRLTKAQQAAAANLGRFPRSDEIGRDDPQIAAWLAQNPSAAAQPAAVQTADARLVPAGEPLGTGNATRSTRSGSGNSSRTARAERAAEAQSVRRASEAPALATRAAPPVAAAQAPARAATPAPAPASAAAPTPALAATPAAAVPSAQPVVVAALPEAARPVAPPVQAAPQPAAPVQVAAASTAVPVAAQAAASAPVQAAAAAAPVPARTTAPAPAPAAPPPPRDLAQAFADLRQAQPVAVSEGAVDLSKIRVRREPPPAPKTPPPPPKPVHPSRHWAQVATGRDTGALAFDWRRLRREAAGLLDKYEPQYAKWGQTNRMVVGPFASQREADQFIGKLKDKKIDSFRFTSEAGEEVKPLP